jgi:DNA-directed RNA polymerase specialized sigma24 family protein
MDAEFDTTDWDLVAAACSPSIATKRDALGRVFETYRRPIAAWLRRCGADAQRAEELASDFFAKVMVERELLSGADPAKGRLRELLRRAAMRFRIDALRRESARNHSEASAARTREQAAIDADEAWFDGEWARRQLEVAVDRTRDRLLRTGRTNEWAVFELCVLHPALHATERPTMEAVAARLGLPGPATASNLLHQAKARVRAMFKEVISETVGASADFRAEIEYIERALRHR